MRFEEHLATALESGQPFALAIISRTKGSSPQKRGAKAIFFADGRILGTLGGGCLEAEIQDRARRALRTGEPATFDLVLDHDFGWDDGLICGGAVHGLILPRAAEAADVWRELIGSRATPGWGVREGFAIAVDTLAMSEGWIYREGIVPRFALWIAGSGHVAQAVAPLALKLDFDVSVFDDRPALANHEYFPPSTRLRVGSWDEILSEQPRGEQTFGVIVTRGHQHDALVLRQWLQLPFAFLAMIGSARKRRVIFDQFIAEGIATAQQLEQVACPAGLDIHAVSVEEIGVSIAAQLVEKRATCRNIWQHGSTSQQPACRAV